MLENVLGFKAVLEVVVEIINRNLPEYFYCRKKEMIIQTLDANSVCHIKVRNYHSDYQPVSWRQIIAKMVCSFKIDTDRWIVVKLQCI